MKRKITKKPHSQKRQKIQYSVSIIHIVSVSFVILIVVLVGTLTFKALNSSEVLGSKTGPSYLADDGSDTQDGSGSSGDQNNQQLPPPPTGTDHPSVVPPQGHFEEQREGNKNEINLETPHSHIEIKKQNGSVHISAHQEGENEIQSKSDGLDKINEALKDKDVKVSSTSGDGFSIESGQIHAETHFPLSVDPTTHTLTVTTPTGTKEVTVLPDQAVQNLLQHQILSTINQSSGSGTTTNTISLTQVNNQPVFAVPGQSDKKLLGLFPVSFDKTVFVSTQTGQVIQTQENFISKLLETLSF